LSIAVVDAAFVVDLICGFLAAEPFRAALASTESVAAPAHLDAEVLSALSRLNGVGQLTRATKRVEALATLGPRAGRCRLCSCRRGHFRTGLRPVTLCMSRSRYPWTLS